MERHFLNQPGFKAGTGGGDESSYFVYVYLINVEAVESV